MKIVIFHLKFLPYHLPRISALGKLFDVVGVEITDKDKDYDWDIFLEEKAGFFKEGLFKGRYVESIPKEEQKKSIFNILDKYMPDVVIVPGWGWYFCRVTLDWAIRNNKKSILMSDSKVDDQKRSFIKEYFKGRIVKKFNGALVAGAPHKDYLVSLGMIPEKILPGFDVVDNDFISKKVEDYIEKEQRPVERKYFLTVNRRIKYSIPFLK